MMTKYSFGIGSPVLALSAGALKDSEDRKKAELAQKNYKMEYEHCMKAKGF